METHQRLGAMEKRLESIEQVLQGILATLNALPLAHNDRPGEEVPDAEELPAIGRWVIAQLGWQKTKENLEKAAVEIPTDWNRRAALAGNWALTQYRLKLIREKMKV